MAFESIYNSVSEYYSGKVRQFGATANGVDWKNVESQNLRFQQLLKILDGRIKPTVCDWGCGYGALLDYLKSSEYDCAYSGYDFSEDMIDRAKTLHLTGFEEYAPTWHSGPAYSVLTDFVIASGIFNVKLNQTQDDWFEYIVESLGQMNRCSRYGFAFNMLTSYSDKEFMRNDLFYASPSNFFDLCKLKFSNSVALLHDYPLYEFTILVRK